MSGPGEAVVAGWRRLHALDLALLLRVQRRESERVTRLMCALTHLGDTATWVAATAVLAAAGGAAARCASLLAAAAVLALALSQALKRLCCRPRPRLAAGSGGSAGARRMTEDPDAFSFPSGHTAAAFAIAVVLGRRGDRPRPSSLFPWPPASAPRASTSAPTTRSTSLVGALLGTLAGLGRSLSSSSARSGLPGSAWLGAEPR